MRPFAVSPARISVNGVEIAGDAIAREAQNHPSSGGAASFAAAAQALVVRELLLQEARRLDVAAKPRQLAVGLRETAEDALINALIAREVTVPAPDAESCRRYYDANLSRFRTPDLFEASHILLAAAPGDAPPRHAARSRATQLAAMLRDDATQFEALAQLHSACSSAAQGGNLGQIGPGQTVAEFEDALNKLAPGEISAPVESRFGFHIICLTRRIAGEQLPFAQVHSRIAAYLEQRAEHAALHSYVRWLGLRARIEGIEFETGRLAPATVTMQQEANPFRFAAAAEDAAWTTAISALNTADDPAAAFRHINSAWDEGATGRRDPAAG